jgi:hypothetical protein
LVLDAHGAVLHHHHRLPQGLRVRTARQLVSTHPGCKGRPVAGPSYRYALSIGLPCCGRSPAES